MPSSCGSRQCLLLQNAYELEYTLSRQPDTQSATTVSLITQLSDLIIRITHIMIDNKRLSSSLFFLPEGSHRLPHGLHLLLQLLVPSPELGVFLNIMTSTLQNKLEMVLLE